jgi:hypothetical protein
MMNVTRKYFVAFGLLLLTILLIQYALSKRDTSFPEARVIGAGNPSFSQLSERFAELTEKKGGVYAYQVLKIAPLPPGIDVHLMGHVVGDIFYKQVGIDGIKDCTQDFRNACSHTIVVGALNEFGTGDATIAMITAACHKAPGGVGAYTMCFHGLGHGVFAFFGYDIPKAVAFCKRLGTAEYGDQEYTQCVGGMTMELVGGGGHDHDQWVVANEKYLTFDDPLSPCDRSLIPAEAKSFCYTYLTPHLFDAAGADRGNPDPSTFAKAFSYCGAIRDTDLRDTCYGSFGKEFIPLAAARDIRNVDQMTDEEYSIAISWCMYAPNTNAREQCIGQALASVFWGGENDPQASFRFCSLAGEEVRSACYAHLGQNIASYTWGAVRSTLCEQLPSAYQNDCKSAVIAPKDRS